MIRQAATDSPEAAMIFSLETVESNSAEIRPLCMTMIRCAMDRHSLTSEVV